MPRRPKRLSFPTPKKAPPEELGLAPAGHAKKQAERLRPLAGNILCRAAMVTKTKGGLLLPESKHEDTPYPDCFEVEVVAVGPGEWAFGPEGNQVFNRPCLIEGQTYLVPKLAWQGTGVLVSRDEAGAYAGVRESVFLFSVADDGA